MNPRELFLLSPYRLPTHTTLMLSNEDVAAFLNGYSALWHPAALRGATGPPRIASQYDHEQPTAGHVYAVPESPSLFFPDAGAGRSPGTGFVPFCAAPGRQTTQANLNAASRKSRPAPQEPANEGQAARLLTAEQVGPFLGIGFGYLQLGTL